MATQLSTDDKYNLIIRNLQETFIDETIVKKIIDVRPLKIYWGTAPTGRIHLGYFVPMLKICDYLNAGCEVTILIADLHAVLDSMKSTFEQVDMRSRYYTIVIQELLKSLSVDINKLKFVKGTDFQLSKEYTLDVYRANTLVSLSDAKHAGAEVVKQSDNPKLTGLLYPTLQALDEQYLGVDVQTGGIDQRKLLVHARQLLPQLGYKKRFHLMNKMVSGLKFEKRTENHAEDIQLDKMSSSNNDSKIDLLDTKNQIKSKINKAYCLPGDVNDNCLLTLLETIIFPVLQLKQMNFVINRKEEYGGNIVYNNIDDVINDFKEEKLHPGDLKLGMIDAINTIIEPIRNVFNNKELKELVNRAYSD